MSTRSSIYYEENGVHIFYEYLDDKVHLEYEQGAFSVNIALSDEFRKWLDIRTKG